MSTTSRRALVVPLVLSAAMPRMLWAQPPPRTTPYRIGLLPNLMAGDGYYRRVLVDALRELGFVQARDYEFVDPGAGYGDPIEPAAQRMLASGIDLALVASAGHALGVARLSPTVPIVMWTGAEPVAVGLAESLAHPGKNVTGVSHYTGLEMWGKLLELLREARPSMKRVGVLWGYVPPAFPRVMIDTGLGHLAQAARSLGLTAAVFEVTAPPKLPATLASVDAARPDGLLVAAGPGFFAVRDQAMRFAIERQLPTIADGHWPQSDERLPLLAYAPLPTEQLRQAARFIVRIAKGEKPGELPIELPARIELVVNLKTAKAIGLTLPGSLLLRADRVNE